MDVPGGTPIPEARTSDALAVGVAGRGAEPPALHEGSIDRIAQRLKVLADPTRLRLLAELRDGEICVGDLAGQVGGSQANVSKHLAVLRKEGLVSCRRDGMNVCYTLADPSVFRVCQTVLAALADHADRQAEELRAACGEEPDD